MPAPPGDLELPFFASGLLKPTELGYHHVAALVDAAETASTNGARLCIRDGLPLLLNEPHEPHGSVHGVLLTPAAGKEGSFYQAIRGFEPACQYQGFSSVEVATARGRRAANALWARRPDRGVEQLEGSSWSSANDPLLTEALAVVRRDAERLLGHGWLVTLRKTGMPPTPQLFERFFRLQASYLLLWTIVERAAAFIVGPDARAVARLKRLEELPEYRDAFAAACVETSRPVTDVRDPDRLIRLHPDGHAALHGYWYTVRSTVTHRGKAAFRDVELVGLALVGLHDVLRRLLATMSPPIAQRWCDREPEGAPTLWALRPIILGAPPAS